MNKNSESREKRTDDRIVIKTPYGTITRRKFVAGAAATAGAAAVGLAGCASGDPAAEAPSESEPAPEKDATLEHQAPYAGASEDVWRPSQCNMCFNHCSILGHVVDGKLVEIKGDDRSPAGWGHLCGKGTAGIMQLYDPNRISVPLRRTNPEKGIGIDPQWEEISWDEAYQEIIDKLAEQRDKNKPVIVFALITSIISWIDSMNWLGAMGNIPQTLKADICGANTHSIAGLLTGCGNSLPDYAHVKYLMQFGTQAGVATRHGTSITAKLLAESRVNGCKLVNFDPHMSASAEKADEWVPIRPGTDAAAALGIAHQLVNELGIYDEEFLTNRTNAPSLVNPETKRIVRAPETNKALYWDTSANEAKPYDECESPALEGDFEVDGTAVRTAFSVFKDQVSAYTPERVEEITTVPADTIKRLAKEFGEAACIGQTETVDGIEVPYRPVAADNFSGIARHKHGFLSNWAILQLNTLVGATFARGGYLGYYTANKYGFYEGDTDHLWQFDTWEEDGLINELQMAHGYPQCNSTYAKVRESDYVPKDLCLEALYPISIDQHFGYISQVDPTVYNTEQCEMAFCMASNVIKDWCNNDYQARLMETFKWIFGMDIYLNESSYYYDLIIPEPCYLERYDPLPLSFNNHRVPGSLEVPFMVTSRQPIVEARDNCPSALDSFGAMAEMAGRTKEFAAAMNEYYHIADEYKLPDDEQVTARAVCDAAFKSLSGEAGGLDWFAENGPKLRERKADEVYVFAAGQEGRVPLYLDMMLEAKEKIEASVEKLGIYWETDDYVPLPEWMPCCDYEIEDPDYDLLPVYWTNAINTDTWQVENAWINEINEADDISYFLEINTAVGKAKGIETGDKVRLSNRDGDTVEGIAVLTEACHPEVVASMGGHLGSRSDFQPISKSKGYAINHLIPAGDPKRMEYVGSGVDQCVRCKIEKIS
ncbi:molybdopterin-dependent oxidoreductase [Xiamenia xianingshaonis]|uniref:Molybdopterin-dependent oxidoreductase n=1 Tax=Xiamenia xianingshaonis TaxID=2682776 RepID=A0A9E6MRI9_9ACTN|nr:molybdopterin-dependent oxidoreductase [Xiamenia xianingshaonis]NHM13224.1 molybdopterin-dependent oxidoreductase [Xiamenia xianingshaonis]QTU84687.1 molybdopterin-dependent oxidoreductase [Xiamenia xianingshaonis]